MNISLKNTQFTRFLGVGAINTLVDFTIFFVLSSVFGVHFLVAVIISTTAAFATSFLLNSRYTFEKLVGIKGVVLFLTVTLTGIWLVQPLVMYCSEPVLRALLVSVDQHIILLVCKLAASAVSLLWNFFLYKNVVYRTA